MNQIRLEKKTADHDETFASSIKDHGTVVLGLAPNNNKTIYYDNQKFGLVTQGDEAKQFVPQYKGLQKNIALLEDASAGLGSMSIGNNDSIVRTIPTFETINDKLIPSFPLELVFMAMEVLLLQLLAKEKNL